MLACANCVPVRSLVWARLEFVLASLPGPIFRSCLDRSWVLRMSGATQLEPIPCREGTKCLSCNQGPNDVERDLLPERTERVAWERKAKDATGTAPDN